MEVARTSMIHAAAPQFLWPFSVRYAAHQLNLWPRVSLPKTSPTLRWTGEVGDASVFWVWGSRAFVRDTSADKLSPHAIPCVFLGFPPDVPGWKFYHPTSCRVFPSRDVTFDESVPFYHPLPGTVPVEVAVDSGAARGVASGGAASGGAEPGGAESEGAGSGGAEPRGAEPAGVQPGGAEPVGSESGGAEPVRVERGGAEHAGVAPGGAESEGAESGGAEPRVTSSSGGPRTRLRSGAAGAGDPAAGDTGAGGTGVTTGAGGTGGGAAAGPRGARTRGTGAAGTGRVGGAIAGGAATGDPAEPGGARVGGSGAGGAGAGGAGAGDPRAVGARAGGTDAGGAGAGGAGAAGAVSGGTGAGGTVQPRPYFFPLLQQVLGLPSSAGLTPPLLCPPPDQSQLPLRPASPLPAPSPYPEQTGGLTERREPESRPTSPVRAVRTSRRVPRPRPPTVPGTHAMALCPSSVPLRVPLPPTPESSLPAVPDLESVLARAASPTVSRLLATVVTDPSFESTAASTLVAELVDFAAACRLNYATALVSEPESAIPPSVGGDCALRTDVLEDKQEDFECLAAVVPHFSSMLLAPEGDPDALDIPILRSYAEAITSPYSSHWQAAMDAEMASWYSTGTYVNAVPPSQANIVNGIWILRVKWPTGSPPAFKITQDKALRTIPLTHSHMVHQVLQPFGFQFSSPQPTPLSTGHSLSAPPSDESVEPSGPYPELVGCLMYLMTCTRPDLAYPLSLLARYVAPGRHRKVHWDAAKSVLRYLCNTSGMGLLLGGRGPVVLTGHIDASWVDDSATQRSSQGYTFSLGSGSVSWRSTHSSSVLSSSCEAEIYAWAMVSQELRWLTYVLTDLGEQPRSPPVLYVDNKAMIALCQEHRLEHRTKHIALRYVLARELQQHGQLRLAYVATRANTADIFTEALSPGDHQRFSTVLGLVPTLPHLLTT
ncbi:unnamed protein product [Closterium sp. NIES-53]